ncbi:CRISPR-associated DxTHG motif protein [Planktothrix agardhii 1813]|nr:CRISPR-associated DxTHG motif protein [Planktothrix agardhii 1813]
MYLDLTHCINFQPETHRNF